MGEVCRAGDARPEREARLLASLNHPSIAAIYGFETSDVDPCRQGDPGDLRRPWPSPIRSTRWQGPAPISS